MKQGRQVEIGVQPGPVQAEPGWADFDLTRLHTPWVDPVYKEKVDMIIDFYMPFASPGPELKQKMAAGGPKGYAYRSMHKLAAWRVGKRDFRAPIEWQLKKRRGRK